MLRATAFFRSPHRTVTPGDVRSAFKVIGLQPGAAVDEVRKQYLKLARQNHPDVNGGDDTKMKLVNLAYETVQSHSHLLKDEAVSGTPGASGTKPVGGFEPNSYKRKWQRKGTSEAGNHAAWQERSEFDWAAAVGVTAEERMDGRNHPNTFNKFFSFDTDATLYQQVRSGATVEEAARTLGITPIQAEKRLNSAQFKQRVQRMMRTKAQGPRAVFRSTVNPLRKAVVRERQPAEGELFDEDFEPRTSARATRARPATDFNARNLVMPMGRNYEHLRRFVKKERSPPPP
jgi:hypothetical protein